MGLKSRVETLDGLAHYGKLEPIFSARSKIKSVLIRAQIHLRQTQNEDKAQEARLGARVLFLFFNFIFGLIIL